VTLIDQVIAERFDKGRLAGTGYAGDADADGVACMRQERAHDFLRALLVIVARRLDQGNRLGERPPLLGQDSVYQLLVGSIQHTCGRNTCFH